MSAPFTSDKFEYSGPIRLVRLDPRDMAHVPEKEIARLARMGFVVIFAAHPAVIEDNPNE